MKRSLLGKFKSLFTPKQREEARGLMAAPLSQLPDLKPLRDDCLIVYGELGRFRASFGDGLLSDGPPILNPDDLPEGRN